MLHVNFLALTFTVVTHFLNSSHLHKCCSVVNLSGCCLFQSVLLACLAVPAKSAFDSVTTVLCG